MTDYRQTKAKQVRDTASQMAYDREHPAHQSNGDEQRYASAHYAMSFTKGLEHSKKTGVIEYPDDYDNFRAAIDNGDVDAFTTSVRSSHKKCRKWEAPTAGLVYDLQGPDSQAVTMAPAPALGSKELCYEMAEVYELALLRDVNLNEFSATGTGTAVQASCDRLNAIGYALDGSEGRPRLNDNGKVTPDTVFRGSSPGVEKGPYLSQFMLIGNASVSGETVGDGKIAYGALSIDQKVPEAVPGKDYMIKRDDWLKVQNGADTRKNSELFGTNAYRRFISTPRDLATYVHDDALYEAYLNACLILLGMGTPLDASFDKLSGQGNLYLNSLDPEHKYFTDLYEYHEREAGGFALWGGPHILTLVTEVATRALKAVRYQKFNTHMRLRPEALAGRIEYAKELQKCFPLVGGKFKELEKCISKTVKAINEFNKGQENGGNTKLLPMAFQEGSPMHPAYGAGHATVAGACVTILKAFFDTSTVLVKRKNKKTGETTIKFDHYQPGNENCQPVARNCTTGKKELYEPDQPVMFQPDAAMDKLVESKPEEFLTLEGELNKLAANISIGRNMAGVHYFSDYYDSLRMGEEIAIGILEEQALCYPTDNFVMSLPKFDGDVVRIGRP